MLRTALYGLRVGILVLACCLSHAQTISSISPNPVGIGQSVTISGSNFGTSGTVTFNGVSASTTSWASTAIIATVPAGTTAGNVVVDSGGHSSNGFPFTLNNGPVSYVYDDLGRLAAVIDVNGNAAEYSYDAVGNILSISRFTSTQVSIINFSPESDPTGTLVTINGTGFSTTPTQNAVKFNGVAATVSSATGTQLQATVPSTATTGPISVTSPNGSATSVQNFTVTSSNGAPTITSFSPTSGVAATAISIVGTNFNTTPANDELKLNASQATVSSATSTTIATTVPAATSSGHFTLLTPAGNAVSSQDFYVPFGSHVATDIGFTARISSGGSQLVTLASSKIGLVLFDGVEGQHVSIGMTGSTFSTCSLYLVGPNNSTVATTSCTAGTADLGSTYLPTSGTYTIGIDPGSGSGSITVTLVGDILGTIAIDGQAVTVTTTSPGQDARLTFTATPAQRVVVTATNVTNPYATLFLVSPNGANQATVIISNSPTGYTFLIDTQTLSAGTNQLWVQHSGSNIGAETLQISSVPADFTATLTVPAAGATGTAVQVPSTGNLALGQNASLTLNANSGQQLSVNLLNSTIGTSYTNCQATVTGPSPSTTQIGSGYCGDPVGGTDFIDQMIIPATGAYTVFLNPQGTATGAISVSVNNDQDVSKTISIGGPMITAATLVPGQDARATFTPTSSQRIVVFVTSVTNPSAAVVLWNGTSSLASVGINNNPSGQTFFIDTQSVTANQQYQLWVQHVGVNYGSQTLQIKSVPADISHTVTVGASAYNFSTVAGQNANIKFTISAAKPITVQWTAGNGGSYPTYPGCNVTVTGPSPATTQVGFGNCNTSNGAGSIGLGTISAGTYNILVDPQQWSAGGMNLKVTSP